MKGEGFWDGRKGRDWKGFCLFTHKLNAELGVEDNYEPVYLLSS
jgi:hypothetical protein